MKIQLSTPNMNQMLQKPEGEYLGEVVDGKRHGRGKCTFNKGGWYEGEWRDDKMCGMGRLEYSPGSYFQGEWVDGLREGNGEFALENGTRYEGEWHQDKFTKGTFYKQDAFYTGDFVNGALHGFVTSKDERGEFEGTYENGFPIYGELKRKDFYYKGNFKQFNQHGNGLEIKKVQNQTEVFIGCFNEGARQEGFNIQDSGRISYQIYQSTEVFEHEVRSTDAQLLKLVKHLKSIPIQNTVIEQSRICCFKLNQIYNPFILNIHLIKESKVNFYFQDLPILTQIQQKTVYSNRVKWILQLILALVELKNNNMQHGNISPENIYIDEKNRAKLGFPAELYQQEPTNDTKTIGKLWFWMIGKDIAPSDNAEEQLAWELSNQTKQLEDALNAYKTDAKFYQDEIQIFKNLKIIK